MPGSQSTPSAALPTSLGDNKTIKFEIKTGNSRWVCTLQDRAAYALALLSLSSLVLSPNAEPER
ncbi:hypothetical protein E4U22_002549 [Claviceps purpurea]|nr:hypothetical protein E4U50_006995 [Claviceps purpurea]KAG6321011.1 hypothetical protein E4U22_002549 [Claviceps purpurea]